LKLDEDAAEAGRSVALPSAPPAAQQQRLQRPHPQLHPHPQEQPQEQPQELPEEMPQELQRPQPQEKAQEQPQELPDELPHESPQPQLQEARALPQRPQQQRSMALATKLSVPLEPLKTPLTPVVVVGPRGLPVLVARVRPSVLQRRPAAVQVFALPDRGTGVSAQASGGTGPLLAAATADHELAVLDGSPFGKLEAGDPGEFLIKDMVGRPIIAIGSANGDGDDGLRRVQLTLLQGGRQLAEATFQGDRLEVVVDFGADLALMISCLLGLLLFGPPTGRTAPRGAPTTGSGAMASSGSVPTKRVHATQPSSTQQSSTQHASPVADAQVDDPAFRPAPISDALEN